MSMDIAHFAFGAAMTAILITVVVPTVPYPRSLVLAGGGWAMLPDVHHVSPYFAEDLHVFHASSPWVDVFWFHRTLDRLDAGDSKLIGTAMLALFIVVTVLAERRSYRTPTVIETLVQDPAPPERPEEEA